MSIFYQHILIFGERSVGMRGLQHVVNTPVPIDCKLSIISQHGRNKVETLDANPLQNLAAGAACG